MRARAPASHLLSGGRATNCSNAETEGFGNAWGEGVSKIYQDGLTHDLFQARQIEFADAVPLRDDDHGVRTACAFIGVVVEFDVRKDAAGILRADRIMGADLGAETLQRLYQGN